MVEIFSTQQLSKAIDRAKAGKLVVRMTAIFRQYLVENRETGSTYTVIFSKRGNHKYAVCTCKGGQNNRVCKHVAAAAGYHVQIAAQQMAA
jgi:hypothetical protein